MINLNIFYHLWPQSATNCAAEVKDESIWVPLMTWVSVSTLCTSWSPTERNHEAVRLQYLSTIIVSWKRVRCQLRPNFSCNTRTLAVCGLAPSCINHWVLIFSPVAIRYSKKVGMQHGQIMITVEWFIEKEWPSYPVAWDGNSYNSHVAINVSLWNWCGISMAQNWTFCVFTTLRKWKYTSSENHVLQGICSSCLAQEVKCNLCSLSQSASICIIVPNLVRKCADWSGESDELHTVKSPVLQCEAFLKIWNTSLHAVA